MGNQLLRDRTALSVVRRTVRSELTRSGVGASDLFDCLVALTEACTQALLHGLDEEADRVPCVSWEIARGAVYFHVDDFSAREWSLVSHPSRESMDETVMERRLEMLGLQLMRGLMDDVSIEMGPEGTRVTLVKRFERATP